MIQIESVCMTDGVKMPTLFGKLNTHGKKPVQSKYGPGISSTDLANFPPSPSSQDARELVYDPKDFSHIETRNNNDDDELENGHRRVSSNDNPILSERSMNNNNNSKSNLNPSVKLRQHTTSSPNPPKPSTSSPPQPNRKQFNVYAEFGAPALQASRSTIAQKPALQQQHASSRMHKTLPSKPVPQKLSNVSSTISGKSRLQGGNSSINNPEIAPPAQPTPYGYTTIGWDKQMDVPQVAELVLMCGEQIRMRGLTSPLIFSSMALDLSHHNVTSLIRSFLSSPKGFYSSETKFANPHDLAAVIKWSLARIGRVFPVPVPALEMTTSRKGDPQQEENVFIHQRGFLEWDGYMVWATYEKNANYPVASFSAFLDGLTSSTAALLVALFSLLSSTTSYSLRNGMTPSRLARMFGVLVFGLPEDETFEKTYDAYVKVSNATEHLLLAYIRDMSTMEPLPTRLADHVRGYPSMLSSNPTRPGRGVRGVPFTLVSRAVRLYSVDLVQQSRELDLANQSSEWAACIGRGDIIDKEPQLSDRYRKLMNLRSGKHPAEQPLSGQTQQAAPDLEAYSSLADKAWEEFLQEGFSGSDPNKLAFNLTESERKARMKGRKSLQWSQFEQNGFSPADDGLNDVLAFDDLLEQDLKRWPEDRAELLEKIRKTNKAMPAFDYDTTPLVVSSPSMSGDAQGQWEEKPFSRMDDIFPEVYADILLGNGWSNRDELTHRNANFAIVQYNSRPSASTITSRIPSAVSPSKDDLDDRTEAAWFVIEEVVPAQYRFELEAAGRKKNRSRPSLRALNMFRRRNKTINYSSPNPGGGASDSFFDEVFKPGLGTQTKKLTLSPASAVDIARRDSQSSTIRGASSPIQSGDDSQFVSSSVRLLTSLKSRASKRIRRATKDEDDDGSVNAPPPPPKSIPPGFIQQSMSWNSDDFETRSLRDPDLDAFAHADNKRGKMLKSGIRGERRRSKDDSWLDITVHKEGKGEQLGKGSLHGKAATDATPVTGSSKSPSGPSNESAKSAFLSSPSSKPQKMSIDVVGWSREDAPQPRTPNRESSLQNLETTDTILSISPTKSPVSQPLRKSSNSAFENTGKTFSANASNGSSSPLAAVSSVSIKNSVSPNGVSPNVRPANTSRKVEPLDEDQEEDGNSPTLPYLRTLPEAKSINVEDDREKAREARIEAAKERARELRANLNPAAMSDLERRKEERLRSTGRESSSPTSSVGASSASAAANLRANLTPTKTGTGTDVGTETASTSKTTSSPFTSERSAGSRDDPFAKDRFSGRVANLTSKFGGLPAKPITPQSTGNTEKGSNIGESSVGSLKKGSLSPPTTPAKTLTSAPPRSPVQSAETSSPLPSNEASSSPASALVAGLPAVPAVGTSKAISNVSSSPSQWRQRQQAFAANQANNAPPPKPQTNTDSQKSFVQPSSSSSSNQVPSSPMLPPSEPGSRHSMDSNVIGLDNDSIYPEDAVSNFSPDPEEDLSRNGSLRASTTQNRSLAASLPATSLFSNLEQKPAMAGAAAAAAVTASNEPGKLTIESLRAEAEDRPTAMPPGFGQRYQPGMPLSNVEEERESVLSGSNY